MSKKYNPYDEILTTLEQAAKKLGLKEDDYIQLKYPERELQVSVPVRMDDGSIKVFEGYRVQHSGRGARTKAAFATTRMWTWMRSRPWQ